MATIAQETARLSALDSAVIFDLLMDRERLATSGIGDGISIPHLRLNNLSDRLYGIIKLVQPVDFHSLDMAPVDLVSFVFSPIEDGMKHLSRLSRLSRLMRSSEFVSEIRKAETYDSIQAILIARKNFEHLRAA